MLSSLLFIRRMAEVSGVRLVGDAHPELAEPLPRGVVLYEVAGPLFFGAAQAAVSALQTVEKRGVQAVVLDLQAVPAMDATGLVHLESLLRRLNGAGVKVILAGVAAAAAAHPRPRRLAQPQGTAPHLPVVRPRDDGGARLRRPLGRWTATPPAPRRRASTECAAASGLRLQDQEVLVREEDRLARRPPGRPRWPR